MKYVPKKNISGLLNDINDPNKEISIAAPKRARPSKTDNIFVPKFEIDKIHLYSFRKKLVKKIMRFCFYSLLFFSGLSALVILGAGSLKNNLQNPAENILENFDKAVTSIMEFNPENAAGYLLKNKKEINEIKRGFHSPLGIVILAQGNKFLENVSNLNEYAFQTSKELQFLKENSLRVLMDEKQKGVLAGRLLRLKNLIISLRKESETARNSIASVRDIHPKIDELKRWITGEYLNYNQQIYRLEAIIANLGNILSRDKTRLLVFLENPAEIRPGGGFLGSYADISLAQGVIEKIEVIDIYDPDGQLAKKLVQPLHIQL